MRRVRGLDVEVKKDDTGGFVSVDWHCPYCGGYNAGLYFTTKDDVLEYSFEVDHECCDCGETVIIECEDATVNYFD